MKSFLLATILNHLLLFQTSKAIKTNYGTELSFTILGDWGGDYQNGHNKSTPFNDASPRGLALGKAVNAAADPINGLDTDFIYVNGDNFYESGVESIESERWETTFEAIFGEENLQDGQENFLKDLAIYAQTGNHDYKGNVSAQIKYSEKQDTNWKMPDLWYKIPVTEKMDPLTAFKIEIITIDTDILIASHSKDQSSKPEDIYLKISNQYAWIRDQLENARKNKVDYLIVMGHHPVFSAGGHGNTKELVKFLLPLFEEYGVQMYICGHDHQLQTIAHTYPQGR